MPDTILAIVPDDFDLGFKLTGIDTQGCVSVEEAKQCLSREMAEKRYSVIIIDESFLLSFDASLKKKIQETTFPLIMGIPLKRGFEKKTEAKDYFLKMVQGAIGYEIRIK